MMQHAGANDEIELLVKAGLSSAAALKAATRLDLAPTLARLAGAYGNRVVL